MNKKSSEPDFEELPLFDFPLHEGERPRRPGPPAPGRSAHSSANPTPSSSPLRVAPSAAHEKVAADLQDLAQLATASPEQVSSGRVSHKASIGDRFFAGLADLLLHIATLGITALAVLLIGHPLTLKDIPPFLAFGLLFSFLYSVFSLAFWGQTPGMAWAGHLARSVTDEPLTFGQTVLRWMGGLLTLVLAGLPLLLVWAGGRSLSDRLSDSKTLQL